MTRPESVPSSLILGAYKEIFAAERRGARRRNPLGWVLSVPDTHQRTVLAELDRDGSIRVITCSTEDEANAVAAGLYITGEPVIVMIQHAGLYASVNTLRGIALDGKIPIFYMIGLLFRESDKTPRECRHSMVRYCEPLLDLFDVPYELLDGPRDIHRIAEYYRLSRERKGPAAVLVGMETI